MAKYNFQLSDYHAIKQADLEISGMTVVAGVNGCGKSTLSRWLYYVVNVISSFDNFLFADFREQINKSFLKYSKVLEDMANYVEDDKLKKYEHCLSLMSTVTLDNGGTDKLNLYYERAVDCLDEMLAIYILKEQNPKQVKRVLNLFGLNDAKHFQEDMEKLTIQEFSKYDLAYRKLKTERQKSFLTSKIASSYCEKDAFPKNMSFKEDDVELLMEHVGKAYSLDNAIYMGTPTAISLRQSDKVLLNDLKNKVNSRNQDGNNGKDIQDLLAAVNGMLNGAIIEKENFDEVDLFYRSKNGTEIRLEDVASGFKPLAYMERLIENGWLTESTLLEIDEPETNLHPQWVVEFAHLLVLIHKILGTKILITSHNPDMVSAIKYISESEGIAEITRFYLAELSDGSAQYEYRNLGNDINPVFDSFNQSFSTLEKYATDFGKL